ncbi:2Fe-2S ferredoxin isoform X1 [Eucalyptus grandis]|nr:2Fe-2S ferredoxin isoform X1 [Eucalyptus grandis]XP_010047442.1 2Fe-2S ferredoxin isoform X1 [Eucalyptus grandis]XP_010047443.1 2Fe-2S ferredoxin isoform X1 [Eucalyptus grandis]XP_039166234.1 2Fe-2S ferredoxin isoform X1 [Eucalyptus grandis]
MVISRASRIGARVVRELLSRRGPSAPLSLGASTSLARRHLGARRQSSPAMQPSDKLFQGALLQKHFFCSTTTADGAHGGCDEEKDKISVTFIDKDGEEKQIKVPIGMSMLEAAHENDIELEGACEGSLACSTCHVVVMDVEYYNKLDDPTDEENDMLDLAFGLTETSRLGCQVIARPELDGVRLAIPAATRNFAVDGYVPKPH